MDQETDDGFAQEQPGHDHLDDSVSANSTTDSERTDDGSFTEDWLDESQNHPKVTRITFLNGFKFLNGRRRDNRGLADVELQSLYSLQQILEQCHEQDQLELTLASVASDDDCFNHYLSPLQDSGTSIVLSIQPDDTFSQIHRATVSYLIDDHLVYELDLQTTEIYNIVQPSRKWRKWDLPSKGIRYAKSILRYADNIVQGTGDFHDQIMDKAMANNPSCFYLVDLYSCPLCSSPVRLCTECHNQACSNTDGCAAAAINNLRACIAHSDATYCRDCMVEAELNNSPVLTQCPSCSDWRCADDMIWCSGIIPTVSPSDTGDHITDENSHPLKPTPCPECIQSVPPEDIWFTCYNIADEYCRTWTAMPVMSRRVNMMHCLDCASVDSTTCRCGEAWFCGMCVKLEDLLICSICHNIYCDECNYIDFCYGSVCKDCMEEADA